MNPDDAVVADDWRYWFAWRPVMTADRGMRWLTHVHRRTVRSHRGSGIPCPYEQYMENPGLVALRKAIDNLIERYKSDSE